MDANNGPEGDLQNQIQQAFRNSLTLKKKADDMTLRRDSINSTKSEYKDRIEELESHLDQEREYIATLKMEMVGLRSKLEEMEDTITSRQSYNSGMRLDSNILESEYEPDYEALSKNVGQSLMEGNRHVSVIRRVRDSKSIQVDLILANAIKEADEEDSEDEDRIKRPSKGAYFEILTVLLEKKASGQISAQVCVIEEGVQKDYCLVDDKVLLSGFGEICQPVDTLTEAAT